MLQKLTIIGRIGKDAEQRYTPSGKAVVNFSVAVTERKDAPAQWIDVALWGEAGRLTEYLRKGAMVYCEGRPGVRAYKDKSGEPKAALQLDCNSSFDVRIVQWAKDDGDQHHTPSAFDDHDLGIDYSAPGAPLPPLSPG